MYSILKVFKQLFSILMHPFIQHGTYFIYTFRSKPLHHTCIRCSSCCYSASLQHRHQHHRVSAPPSVCLPLLVSLCMPLCTLSLATWFDTKLRKKERGDVGKRGCLLKNY